MVFLGIRNNLTNWRKVGLRGCAIYAEDYSPDYLQGSNAQAQRLEVLSQYRVYIPAVKCVTRIQDVL